MKSTIKLFLVVCLFSSVVLADGEMPTGNRTCPNGATTCFAATSTTPEEETKTTTGDDSILTTVQDYLDSLVEYFAS
ncbi:MAG TPA: hypothetical protein VGC97_01715 [Pyrinomonadaceae bacterium]|jgi:hypothetical protein